MKEPANNPFDLLVEQIRAAVREEMQAGSGANQQRKLLFTTKEVAAMLNIEESWLAARARAGKIPHRMLGHYRYFSQSDIDFIIAKACVPMVHGGHDGQGVQTNTEGAEVKPSTIGEADERDGDGGSAVGERGETHIGAGGVNDETLAQKQVAGGKNVSPENTGGQLGSTLQGPRSTKAKNVSKLSGRGELR